jgi:excisionase family DNA binding protein
MVTGNGDVFHFARNGRVEDGHAEPKSERSRWQDDHPPSAGVGSLSVAENHEMISVNRIQDPLDRLATVAERYMDFLEREARANDAETEKRGEWLTPKEVSVLLRVHVQTVQKLCREGKLEAERHLGNKVNGKGGKYVIHRKAIDAYIAKQRLIHGSQKAGAK